MTKLHRVIAALLLLAILAGGCNLFGKRTDPATTDSALTDPAQTDAEGSGSPAGTVGTGGPGDQPFFSESPVVSGGDGEYSGDFSGDNGSGSFEFLGVTHGEFRAVWVATVLNLDFPSRQTLSAAAMRREIDAMVSRAAAMGLNAVVFQARPAGDALYKSEIFPWSQWLAGTQGVGLPGFDPLAYWIEACHAKGLELHAWLNPYRIIHTTSNSSDPGTLAPDNPVRLNPELAVAWTNSSGNSGLFLDPGLPEAQKLIIDGIVEIITNYDVDGIHFDDYFYPGVDFNDAASFALYGGGMELEDWRRENVNNLIKNIQSVIRRLNRDLDKKVLWGISPSAIWKNGSSDPLGVPTTKGQESYHALYADTRRWVMEEWVDYICPQIYWYIGYDIADFKAIFNWWEDLCRDTRVALYVGHAAYREEQGDQSPKWEGEIIRQLSMVADSNVAKGSILYRMYSLRGSLGRAVRDFYKERADSFPVRGPVLQNDRLTVGMPDKDVTFSASADTARGYTILGTSLPDIPLYMNGVEVTGRTVEGFFTVYAPLQTGPNVFVFSQEGQEDVTRTITRNAPVSGGGTPSSPAPVITKVDTPVYATVTAASAWIYPGNTTSGGSDWMLVRGQQDRVVAEADNNYVKLSCGMWIHRNSVSIEKKSTFESYDGNVLSGGTYRTGVYEDVIAWKSAVSPVIYVTQEGQTLKVSFGMQKAAPDFTFPNDTAGTVLAGITGAQAGEKDGIPNYTFTIRDGVKYEGCYTDYADGEFRLHLKKRKTLAEGALPLVGFTIVLDPGHGGDQPGAVGPMGGVLQEKDITLINSLKLAERLRAAGATVYLTRETDASVELQERVDLSWSVKPDLFLSLHINSVGETTNATNIHGFTVWYRNQSSVDFAQTALDVLYYINPATNRNRVINQSNLYVCRPQWAPSVLFEASFIVNLDDFVWMIDPAEQDNMAEATLDAIFDYFS